ncbi:phage tail protein [uncultured Clostridium sp.]|uniref:phage tail protein n=1 Tax=uncultured Clostridium sp. TaxID=59620 RepID=UPI0025DCDBC7|nr:phage tail protein [uncultured Clostridium sp.]
MSKFNSLNKAKYNSLGESKFNSTGSSIITSLERMVSRVGPRPTVLDSKMRQIAILETSKNVVLEQEVKGMDELSFSMPLSDSKRPLCKNEGNVLMFDTVYIIRNIIDDKNKNMSDIYCEANWYDLAYAEPFTPDKLDWVSQEVFYIMKDILEPTEWEVGTVEVKNKVTMHLDIEYNRLSALRKLESLCSGELVFNTVTKKIDMVIDGGKETGALIMYEKNAKTMTVERDTRELITKLIPYGADDMTIADANDGVIYIEDYSYTDKVRCQVVKDDRYTNPYELKTMGEKALAELSKPRSSYKTTISELMTRSGLEHENFFIGGLVRIHDTELGIDVKTRIMKWTVNVSELWDSDVILESKAKSLSELLAGLNTADLFSVSGSSGELMSLSVYNNLLNSRADDGFFSWANEGWEIDPSIGGSGHSSFKAVGAFNKEKVIKQTCYPSSRNCYSISFKGQTSELVKGTNARIGIEVVVTYEDGTTENKFISLI